MDLIGPMDDGKEFPAKVDDELSIRLPENPTSGFSWQADVTDGIMIREDRFESRSPLIGSGGDHLWTLRIERPGRQQFTGIYRRPFESITGMEKRFTVGFIVQ